MAAGAWFENNNVAKKQIPFKLLPIEPALWPVRNRSQDRRTTSGKIAASPTSLLVLAMRALLSISWHG